MMMMRIMRISELSIPNFNWAYLGFQRGQRGSKKGKSSEFNQKNNEQVKSNPAVKVWLHDSVKVGVKFDKWVNFRVPQKVFFCIEGTKIDFLTMHKS